ncbi:MAG: hypothetical protein WDN03_02175 [Rhizomicrobium sp.]
MVDGIAPIFGDITDQVIGIAVKDGFKYPALTSALIQQNLRRARRLMILRDVERWQDMIAEQYPCRMHRVSELQCGRAQPWADDPIRLTRP